MAEFDLWLVTLLRLAALALAAWAFIDALTRPAPAYVAVGKLTKPAWAAITGVSVVAVYIFGVLSFLGLPAVVAAVVYLVDVRPAVRGLPRGNSW